MKRLLYNIIAICAIAVFAVLLILGNVSIAKTPAVCEKGSFAEQYASKKHLPTAELPDSMKDALDWRYETFEYNKTSEGLVLTKYNGISSNLVIPEEVNGIKVIGLDDTLFENEHIVKIYIPETVKELPEEAIDCTIILNTGDDRIKSLESIGWIVETYDDSEAPNFHLGTVPFEYDESDSSINLKLYTGDEDILVIPSYIDGKPVTDVSFNMLGDFDLVVLPATLTAISGTLSKTLYTPIFAVELVFTIIAFIIAMIVFNVKLPKMQEDEEAVLTGSQLVISELYVIAQVVFALLSINKGIVNLYTAIIISSVLLVAEIVFVFLVSTGRKHVKEVEQQISISTEFMDDLKQNTADLAVEIMDSEVKKAVEEVVDEIKYSPPVSKEFLKPLEAKISDEVKQLKEALESGNNEETLKICKVLLKDVKERNRRTKN